jgi:hypothetical protein
MENRKGLTPETLTAEEPVAELVVHGLAPQAGLAQVLGDSLFELAGEQTVIPSRLDRLPFSHETGLASLDLHFLLLILPGSLDHRDDGRPNCRANSKSRVSCAGTAMIAPGAVADQNVVGNPDRDLRVVDGIASVTAGEHTGLPLGDFQPFAVALHSTWR